MSNWKELFNKGKEITFATSSKDGFPNANIVASLGFIDGKIMVADCQMKRTIKNLRENPNVCILGGYYRIKGTVEIFPSGEYFDLCVRNSEGYEVKNAILITISQIFDLDKGEIIELTQDSIS